MNAVNDKLVDLYNRLSSAVSDSKKLKIVVEWLQDDDEENDDLLWDCEGDELDEIHSYVGDCVDDVGFSLYSEQEYGLAEIAFERTRNYNNLIYMIRRGEVEDLSKYSTEDVIELIIDGIRKRDSFAMINLALFWVSDVVEEKNWDIADKIMSILPRDRRANRFEDACEWWTNLAMNDEVEGYLVILWLYRHYRIEESPVGSQEEILKEVKSAIPDLPEFFYED